MSGDLLTPEERAFVEANRDGGLEEGEAVFVAIIDRVAPKPPDPDTVEQVIAAMRSHRGTRHQIEAETRDFWADRIERALRAQKERGR